MVAIMLSGVNFMNISDLKQQSWFRPLMPFLRELRRTGWRLKHAPALWLEKSRSQRWSRRYNPELYPLIESALHHVKRIGGYFEGWALSASALRAFTQQLLKDKGTTPQKCVVEFGSGQSTLYWGELLKALPEPLHVHTYEHHPEWASYARKFTEGKVHLHQVPLLQVTDELKKSMFSSPEKADVFFQQGQQVSESEWENTRILNTFYDVSFGQTFALESIHGVILDGPNGNGRSLVFPLIRPYLAPQALILIDDYDHYPFLDDLNRLCDYDMLHVSHRLGKRWCLLRLK